MHSPCNRQSPYHPMHGSIEFFYISRLLCPCHTFNLYCVLFCGCSYAEELGSCSSWLFDAFAQPPRPPIRANSHPKAAPSLYRRCLFFGAHGTLVAAKRDVVPHSANCCIVLDTRIVPAHVVTLVAIRYASELSKWRHFAALDLMTSSCGFGSDDVMRRVGYLRCNGGIVRGYTSRFNLRVASNAAVTSAATSASCIGNGCIKKLVPRAEKHCCCLKVKLRSTFYLRLHSQRNFYLYCRSNLNAKYYYLCIELRLRVTDALIIFLYSFGASWIGQTELNATMLTLFMFLRNSSGNKSFTITI